MFSHVFCVRTEVLVRGDWLFFRIYQPRIQSIGVNMCSNACEWHGHTLRLGLASKQLPTIQFKQYSHFFVWLNRPFIFIFRNKQLNTTDSALKLLCILLLPVTSKTTAFDSVWGNRMYRKTNIYRLVWLVSPSTLSIQQTSAWNLYVSYR